VIQSCDQIGKTSGPSSTYQAALSLPSNIQTSKNGFQRLVIHSQIQVPGTAYAMHGARPSAVTSGPAQRSPTQDPAFTRVEDHGVSTAHSFKSHARLFPRSRFCLSFCLPFCPLFSFVFFISFLFSLSAGGNGHPTCLVKSRGQRRRRAGTLQ
jgi:hypothetical protein